MRLVTLVALAALVAVGPQGCGGVSMRSAPPSPPPVQAEPDMFRELAALDWQSGSGTVTWVPAAMIVTCQQETLPSREMQLNTLLPPRVRLFKVRYEFVLSRKSRLRCGYVNLTTDFAPDPADAGVSDEVRQQYHPRPCAALEYELLLATYLADRDAQPQNKIMVRSRLVYHFDDVDTGWFTSGHSWLPDAPVFAPDGADSAQAGSVAQRWDRTWPWVYTILDVPPAAQTWWAQYLRERAYIGTPAVVRLVHGYYEPDLGEWATDRPPPWLR